MNHAFCNDDEETAGGGESARRLTGSLAGEHLSEVVSSIVAESLRDSDSGRGATGLQTSVCHSPRTPRFDWRLAADRLFIHSFDDGDLRVLGCDALTPSAA